jgi:hypothetical protein
MKVVNRSQKEILISVPIVNINTEPPTKEVLDQRHMYNIGFESMQTDSLNPKRMISNSTN